MTVPSLPFPSKFLHQNKSSGQHYRTCKHPRKPKSDKPPAHYMLRIESFSLLSQVLQITAAKRYESLTFKAGGYNWKLSLDPNVGKGSDGHGDGHISLYLMIVETSTLPLGWMIDVNFKLFVYDQIRDKYHVFEDSKAKARRFHAMKTEWGFSKLLSHKDFADACNGCLVGDTCVFGAEVYVENENHFGVGECLSMLNTKDEGFTWKIDNFSLLDEVEEVIKSTVFTAGGLKWSLSLYPKGDSKSDGESLSLLLDLVDHEAIRGDWKTCARFRILVKDQLNNKHYSRADAAWFDDLFDGWRCTNFMPLRYLQRPSRGFLVNDTLVIEFKLVVMSNVKKFT
ncbi:hypothetical protein SLE2022_243080 [Rubroshorea leprosula]